MKLKKGDVGTFIIWLQHILIDEYGYAIGLDGRFGSETQNAVDNLLGQYEAGKDDLLDLIGLDLSSFYINGKDKKVCWLLPDGGRGYVTYNRDGNDQFATEDTLARMMDYAEEFFDQTGLLIELGNIGRLLGGKHEPHNSHHTGTRADMRPIRKDGKTGSALTYQDGIYSSSYTQKFVDIVRSDAVGVKILFNDGKIKGVKPYPGHSNHLHLDFSEVRSAHKLTTWHFNEMIRDIPRVAKKQFNKRAVKKDGKYTLSPSGHDFIELWEGVRLTVYPDVVGLPTVGIGHLVREKDKLKIGDKITTEHMRLFFEIDKLDAENRVNALVSVPLTQNQFDALFSLAFNLKPNDFAASTLLKKLNTGDYAGAADQFLVWNKGTDRKTGEKYVIEGLKNRREAERKVFLKDSVLTNSIPADVPTVPPIPAVENEIPEADSSADSSNQNSETSTGSTTANEHLPVQKPEEDPFWSITAEDWKPWCKETWALIKSYLWKFNLGQIPGNITAGIVSGKLLQFIAIGIVLLILSLIVAGAIAGAVYIFFLKNRKELNDAHLLRENSRRDPNSFNLDLEIEKIHKKL